MSHEDFGFCSKCTKAETQMSLLPDPVIHPFTPQTLTELQLAPCLSLAGSSEDDPFSYGELPLEDAGGGGVKLLSPYSSTFLSADEVTLRKRGLIVAAVLFITGIVILTSENGHWAGGALRMGGGRPWRKL